MVSDEGGWQLRGVMFSTLAPVILGSEGVRTDRRPPALFSLYQVHLGMMHFMHVMTIEGKPLPSLGTVAGSTAGWEIDKCKKFCPTNLVGSSVSSLLIEWQGSTRGRARCSGEAGRSGGGIEK